MIKGTLRTLEGKEAELKHAMIEWQLANKQYLRRIKLGRDNSISREELDNYAMQEKLRKADLEKAKAVADNNTDVNNQLLPKVQQTYDWVRLSKRIPVDIALDVIPNNIELVSGMNATVIIK